MIFTIKKNTHHSIFRIPKFTLKKKMKADIILNDNFYYKCDDIKNQKDTNKIIGLSDDYFHRVNSIRIGFRNVNDKIELIAYYYNNTNHYSKVIGEVYEKIPFSIDIEIGKYIYLINFNNKQFIFKRTSKWNLFRYVLYPYFGGNEKAKNDLIFDIKYKLY